MVAGVKLPIDRGARATQVANTIFGDAVTVILGAFQQVQLNADGTLTVIRDSDVGDVNFACTVGTSTGAPHVAFVNLSSVPCFVARTLIKTEMGERPIEALQPGGTVWTKYDGLQPLRRVCRRVVAAEAEFASIRIEAGACGPQRTLPLSPLHGNLNRDALAESLFGGPGVLIAARGLLNDRTVRRGEDCEVETIHILFDMHEVVWSEGLETESCLPGPMVTHGLEAEMIEEIQALFPELKPEIGSGYSTAVHPTLKRFEPRLLATERTA